MHRFQIPTHTIFSTLRHFDWIQSRAQSLDAKTTFVYTKTNRSQSVQSQSHSNVSTLKCPLEHICRSQPCAQQTTRKMDETWKGVLRRSENTSLVLSELGPRTTRLHTHTHKLRNCLYFNANTFIIIYTSVSASVVRNHVHTLAYTRPSNRIYFVCRECPSARIFEIKPNVESVVRFAMGRCE